MQSVHAGGAAAKRKLVQSTLPMLLALLAGGTTPAKKRPRTSVAASATEKEQVLLKYALTIYGYRRSVGDAWPYVYVGQTRCHLDARDAQHLTGGETHFDRAYSLCPGDFRGPAIRNLDSAPVPRGAERSRLQRRQDQARLQVGNRLYARFSYVALWPARSTLGDVSGFQARRGEARAIA